MADNGSTLSEPTFDVGAFWRAIGQRAVGAAIVTAADEAGPAGFLALSPTHLSAAPPMLMVSIDGRTSALATVLSARHFAVNYLPVGAGDVVDAFSAKGSLKGAARFQRGDWTVLTTGAPVLATAVAAFDCALEETIERHGATIAIGRLVDFAADAERGPLISFRGGWCTVA